eukprot:5002251-Amphidinium_carterae.2
MLHTPVTFTADKHCFPFERLEVAMPSFKLCATQPKTRQRCRNMSESTIPRVRRLELLSAPSSKGLVACKRSVHKRYEPHVQLCKNIFVESAHPTE